jgi:hypothetical protein
VRDLSKPCPGKLKERWCFATNNPLPGEETKRKRKGTNARVKLKLDFLILAKIITVLLRKGGGSTVNAGSTKLSFYPLNSGKKKFFLILFKEKDKGRKLLVNLRKEEKLKKNSKSKRNRN